MSDLHVREMVSSDWSEVKDLYRTGIETGHATFEAAPPAAWEDFCATRRLDLCRVAVDADGRILGWVGAGPVSSREVYRGVVEHSIYVHPDASGKGVGTQLLSEFISLTDQRGIWTIQSSIFPENTASLRLHEHAGFRTVGRRERIAYMTYGPLADRWRDTIAVERRRP
ncbi:MULTISPECIES: GNAT family N-acetyltransferase [Brevibacterium]|uniref:N-acetyltransferase n=1 Tax=Brevibacterium aurantiacum TaxID=273384 RepID=A0A2A3ZMD5_BREAU|nr:MULTISPECIES: GNAT family N-acetyltransferase [Brevibacterium]MDN5773648.1 N-acetyltransferase family protein [Brevibacterium aurantiacum]PCC52684.1 N-acetyltransferase [Brevibacterium aurantiacum]WCE40710.1 GNAT family N-acetyltransferase [Brevibacterium sp. BDJS002]